jgi:hypothetical protein
MKGASRCRIHGGSAPQVQRKAKELIAQSIIEREARHYGQPRNISAIDALTEELHRTQGHIDWLSAQVASRPQDANLLAVYAAERAHLAKLAGSMVSAKLDEQRSLLTEKAVEQLGLAITGILRDLGHDPSTNTCGASSHGDCELCCRRINRRPSRKRQALAPLRPTDLRRIPQRSRPRESRLSRPGQRRRLDLVAAGARRAY